MPPKIPAGFSLLEVVLATSLTALALVGGLALLSGGMELSETIDDRQLLNHYASHYLERYAAITASAWSSSTVSEVALDQPQSQHDVRVIVTRSDAVVDGGLVKQLMHIQVTAYIDADGDSTLDAEEKQCTIRTKVGNYFSYD